MSLMTGLLSALVAAVVSGGVSYYFNRREFVHKLQAEYEHQQRRELKEVIGKYHGRMVHAANSLNYRMWNLYRNEQERWLHVRGEYTEEKYYFASFVYRFLAFFTLVREFEAEAVVLDRRIAEEEDFLFLNYTAAFHWVMTDTQLYEGLDYDSFLELDHFFADTFRSYCRIPEEQAFPDFKEFVAEHLNRSSPLRPVLQFFDGLAKHEDRLRWDRMVALHLLIIGFINDFGRGTERTSQEKIRRVADQIQRPEVLENLKAWLPRHGLENSPGIRSLQQSFPDQQAAIEA